MADNVLDLMRFVPQDIPWVAGVKEGEGGGKQQPRSLYSLVSGDAPLLGASGANHTVSLGNKTSATVGLFFGAAWSQPCCNFLPLLRAAYHAIQQKDLNSTESQTSEFIFVSLDQSESEFEQFRKEIPFPAIPFQDRRRALLQVGMNIRSVPSLGNVTKQFIVNTLITAHITALYAHTPHTHKEHTHTTSW